MRFIEELVVEEFLPTFRSLLAERLHEDGLTQNEVAELLGISQSAVSKYVHGEVTRNDRIAETGQVEELVERLTTGLVDGELTPTEALIEAEVCIRKLERGGVLAELHAEAMPGLAKRDGQFAIHDPDSQLRAAGQVRASVRRGLRILQNTEGFAGTIPAVGSNLVECLADARTVDDVAGIPGRILNVRGDVTIPGEPEFGVSQHVATVILTAREHGSEARAALNVSYTPALTEALTAQGQTTVEFDAEPPLAEAVATAVETEPAADVLYQTGGFGVEPVLYILGPDAPTVARTLRECDV